MNIVATFIYRGKVIIIMDDGSIYMAAYAYLDEFQIQRVNNLKEVP